MPNNQTIDFLTVDVEGLDLNVLISNNWSKYRPSFILTEVLGISLEKIKESDVSKFLITKGDEIYAKTINTVIFKRIE